MQLDGIGNVQMNALPPFPRDSHISRIIVKICILLVHLHNRFSTTLSGPNSKTGVHRRFEASGNFIYAFRLPGRRDSECNASSAWGF